MSKTLPEWAKGDGSRPPIVATAAWKGGDGKSTLGYETAYQLGSTLADFDWDKGGCSASWGFRAERRVRAPMLDAFERGTTPTPLTGRRKPDLIPSHPDFGLNQPAPDKIADALEQWARELDSPLSVDTHPGGCDSTYGALQAADVVLVPAVLADKSLNALEGMLEELTDYPLLVIPYMVKSPPARMRKRLKDMTARFEIPVGPMVGYYPWIPTRSRRMAICAEPVSKQALPFVRQIDHVVKEVINYAG
ncbi:ParA family protein [Streptomyces sp. NBC_01750]|uniref:ParA family protein n=1 Tax=Streptomyces sp. NBC_01750 TaxID=2975928 RepID=UPI002DD94895|nr:ParA family protein [Streptomyces sp. NBC_01750]WSD38150.1 ParA family protein [Streptomyces sp. NBC_01750]